MHIQFTVKTTYVDWLGSYTPMLSCARPYEKIYRIIWKILFSK